jgi:transcription elongation factor Elf1
LREENYDPGNTGLILKFPCKQCGYWIKSDEIAIPLPDFSEEYARDSYVDNEENIVCDKCGTEHTVTIWAGRTDGHIEIEELEETAELEIEEISKPYDNYDELYDAIAENKQFYETFKLEIDNLIKLNSIDLGDASLNKILKRQIFISVITTLETFLSDTFINLTLANEVYFRNFIETYPKFKDEKIYVRDIFTEYSKLKEKVKKIMMDILYHRLSEIKEMYKDTFKIVFPDTKVLFKEIAKRHDLVHRAGRTKNGDILDITTMTNNTLIGYTQSFVADIANQLHQTDDPF